MDSVSGAGPGFTTVHGSGRWFGTETTGIVNEEDISQSAWSTSWKTTARCALPPRLPETEDGEDYMSDLAEEIARCMLQDNDASARLENCCAFENTEPLQWGAQSILSTSPQSTLTGMNSWDLFSPGGASSGCLPASAGVSSPPTPLASSQSRKGKEDALDLLYSELLRLKMENEITARQQQLIQLKQHQHLQQLFWQRKTAALSFEALDTLRHNRGSAPFTTNISTMKNHGSGNLFCERKARNDVMYQARVRKQATVSWAELSNQGGRQKNRSAVEQCNQSPYATAYPSKGSHQRTMNGSGMRAVFLGTPGARESGGTGVFLPRRLGSCNDAKRKPACSTVLLPSRIVQALNLNVEETLAPKYSTSANLLPRRDSVSARASQLPISGDVTDARDDWAGRSSAACSLLQEVAPDICLPTEWTY